MMASHILARTVCVCVCKFSASSLALHTLELIKFGMCHVGGHNRIWHVKPHLVVYYEQYIVIPLKLSARCHLFYVNTNQLK